MELKFAKSYSYFIIELSEKLIAHFQSLEKTKIR